MSSEEKKVSGEQQEKPHRKLKLWQASMDFVIDVYKEAQRFPAKEEFGIAAQLQRAAVYRSQATSLKEQQEKIRESCCNFYTLPGVL